MYLLWVRGNLAKGRIGELNFITYILRLGPTSELIASISSAFYSADLVCLVLRVGLMISSGFCSRAETFSGVSVDWAAFAGRPRFFG